MVSSIHSGISAEACASILWKSADKASLAAEAMGITSDRLKELDLIDTIIEEPLGGAHRDYDLIAQNVKQRLTEQLEELKQLDVDTLLNNRYDRLMSFGYC